MHYRNGREAKNGDEIVQMEMTFGIFASIFYLVVMFSTSQAQAGQDCSAAAMTTRVEIVAREPITPVRNILSKIGAVRASACSGVERSSIVRVERVRLVSRVSSCAGTAAVSASCAGQRRVTSCAGARATSCAGSVQALQAYGLGIEAKTVQPTSVRSAGLAQQKAEQQASEGRMRHVGGSFGGGSKEGVGYSSRSSQEAIEKCCYYGQYSPRDIGVARGANGWYATVLY